MAFDPLYAAGPGRPVNVLRDVGQSLLQTPDPALGPPLQPVGTPALPPVNTPGNRLTGAVESVANGLNPTSTYGPEAFLSGATRGFAGVRQYLQNLAVQQQQLAEGRETRDLNRRKTEQGIATDKSQAAYYDAEANKARSAPAAPLRSDDWVPLPGNPGTPALQQNRATGETKPVIGPDGKPALNRAAPVKSPRAQAPHFSVGADGFARVWNPAKGRFEHALDDNGQPFKPRAAGHPSALQTMMAGDSTSAPAQDGTLYNGKTAAQWKAEVDAEHPDWSDDQVTTEAKRRAGVH